MCVTVCLSNISSIKYNFHAKPSLSLAGGASVQVCVHHFLPRRAAEVAGEEDLRGLPCHHVPLPRGPRRQEGDGHGGQNQTR